MCKRCSAVIADFVKSSLAVEPAADARRLISELRLLLPHLGDEELMARVDAAVIRNWGSAGDTPGSDPAHPGNDAAGT